MDKTKVLFVCLGNICRSPMAEALFRDLVEKKGLTDKFEIDSAGTAGYHIGERSDSRSIEIGEKHGLRMDHITRQLKKEDFDRFDYIIGMDHSNITNILRLTQTPEHKAKVHLMMDFDQNSPLAIVEDPWYGDIEGFEEMYGQLLPACEGLLLRTGNQ